VKRPWPYYPPLLGIFPILALFSANLALMPIGDLWRPLGIGLLAAVVVWLLSAAVMRNFEKGSMLAGMAFLAFWTYQRGAALVPNAYVRVYLAAFALLFMGLTYWVVKRFAPTAFLNRLSLFLVVLCCGQIGWHWYRWSSPSDDGKAGVAATGANRPPDIFYIILDGYGRSDQLLRNLDFDNSDFISQLKSLGFYVPDRNHSNYCQTALSLASSLNFDYLSNLLPQEGPQSEDRDSLNNLVNDSRLARLLRGKGYTNIAIMTGFPAFEFPHADLRLTGPRSMTLFESTLLDTTPIPPDAIPIETQTSQRRHVLLSAFSDLDDLAKPTSSPRFIFAHILAPHPPFVFTEDGGVLPRKGPFGYWDGSDYMQNVSTPSNYRSGYTSQAKYISKRVLEVVRHIVSASSRPPIVIVQGDHGSKLHLDQEMLAKTDVNECLSNLAALYVPDSIRAKLYPEITPVNFFRIILSDLFHENLPTYPDRSYYSPFPKPYQLTEVTDKVKGPPWRKDSETEGSENLNVR